MHLTTLDAGATGDIVTRATGDIVTRATGDIVTVLHMHQGMNGLADTSAGCDKGMMLSCMNEPND